MLPKILWGKSYCSPTLQARAITLYWKLTQVHIPFEGVPGPKPRWSGSRAAPVGDRPSCPNRGLLPARGGPETCSASEVGLKAGGSIWHHEAGEIRPGQRCWISWSFQPFDPPPRPFNKMVWFTLPSQKNAEWNKNENTTTQNEKGHKTEDMEGIKSLRLYTCQLYNNCIT